MCRGLRASRSSSLGLSFPIYTLGPRLSLLQPANMLFLLPGGFVLRLEVWGCGGSRGAGLQEREHPPPFFPHRELCLLGLSLPDFGKERCLGSVLVESPSLGGHPPPPQPTVCLPFVRKSSPSSGGGSGALGPRASGSGLCPQPTVFRQVIFPRLS